MRNQIEHNYDVLVVGAGPAGIAAACAAAPHARVALLDDNPQPGGQIWRNSFTAQAKGRRAAWYKRLAAAKVERLGGLRVFDATPHNAGTLDESTHPALKDSPNGTLWAESAEAVHKLHYRGLILATGARERFLPFPGWTLPNVMGAGGLQAMVKSGLAIEGKRVVLAGSGPLLVAVAAFLKQQGAQVLCICEQAQPAQLWPLAVGLAASPRKLLEALDYRRKLGATPYRLGWWPVSAQPSAATQDKLGAVTLTNGRKSETLDCDYLACGFHLIPNLELAQLFGCTLRNGFVAVNAMQQSSRAHLYCAGELTGIGGLEKALTEGAIAGLAATGQQNEAYSLRGAWNRAQRFRQRLDRSFALRAELRSLPEPETIVCRCEDVTHGELIQQDSARGAKLRTRCGMGACQGRICSGATQFLYDWTRDRVRTPILPVRFASLLECKNVTESETNS